MELKENTSAPRQVNPTGPGGFKPGLVILASVAVLTAVSYVDYVTGYESLFFVFYFIPVALCAWYLGRWASLLMSLLSAVSWFVVDVASDHQYPHEGIRYWNAFTCFLAFGVLGWVLSRLRHSLQQARTAREELARALEDLRRSTEEFRELQNEFQVVCAWTQRIRIGGKWMPLDEFLRERLHVTVSHGISPEALEEIRNELEEVRKSSPPENKPVDPPEGGC